MDKLHLIILFLSCILVVHTLSGCAGVDAITAQGGANTFRIGPIPLVKYEF